MDSSALLKLYLDEPGSDECRRLIADAAEVATAIVALVEVRRNLALYFDRNDLAHAREDFERDWERFSVMPVDPVVCGRAASIAEQTGLRPLDAIHVSAAERVGGPLLTYDLRQANAARALGVTVIGA